MLCSFENRLVAVWFGRKKREWGVRADTRSEVLEFVNGIDPSAGSPTETLLRLLLPRNVQI